MQSLDSFLPIGSLIASLTVIGGVVGVAWRVRDVVATKSELQEVKEAVEMCARKTDVESLRAQMGIHMSQSNQALKELQIEIARLDERGAARWETVQRGLLDLHQDLQKRS
jgi:predicted nuclease with TOPRIM domain